MRAGVVAAGALLALQLDAAADPISYDGTLGYNGSAPGDIGEGDYNNARQADYWRFWATAGDPVSVIVDRVDGAYDPAQWIFTGLYTDTGNLDLTNGDHFFGEFETPTFIDFGDDERTPAVSGPFGDPLSTFTAPVTGWYTVAVTEFFSGALPDDKDYDYQITVRGNTGGPVPEPTLLALLACGSFGVALSRRRKTA